MTAVLNMWWNSWQQRARSLRKKSEYDLKWQVTHKQLINNFHITQLKSGTTNPIIIYIMGFCIIPLYFHILIIFTHHISCIYIHEVVHWIIWDYIRRMDLNIMVLAWLKVYFLGFSDFDHYCLWHGFLFKDFFFQIQQASNISKSFF